jgi:hypothetical protein
VLVSAAMIAGGVWQLRQEASEQPVRIGAMQWCGLIAGALVIVIAFAMDYRNILAGGLPRPFNWIVFSLGLGLGTGSYVSAAAGKGTPASARAFSMAGRP